jgi:hypothetical protein
MRDVLTLFELVRAQLEIGVLRRTGALEPSALSSLV